MIFGVVFAAILILIVASIFRVLQALAESANGPLDTYGRDDAAKEYERATAGTRRAGTDSLTMGDVSQVLSEKIAENTKYQKMLTDTGISVKKITQVTPDSTTRSSQRLFAYKAYGQPFIQNTEGVFSSLHSLYWPNDKNPLLSYFVLSNNSIHIMSETPGGTRFEVYDPAKAVCKLISALSTEIAKRGAVQSELALDRPHLASFAPPVTESAQKTWEQLRDEQLSKLRQRKSKG